MINYFQLTLNHIIINRSKYFLCGGHKLARKIKRIKRKRSRSFQKGQPIFLYSSLREEECIEAILRTMISGDPNRSLPVGPIRLNSIKGYSNRTNNVIYCPPLIKTPPDDTPTAVVYFGGDVQVIKLTVKH